MSAPREASPAPLTVMEERNIALKAFGYPDRFSNEPGEWEKFYAGWKARAALASPQVAPALSLSTPLEGECRTISGFLSDVTTAAGLVEHGKQSKPLAERMSKACMEVRLLVCGAAPAPVAPTLPVLNDEQREALRDLAFPMRQDLKEAVEAFAGAAPVAPTPVDPFTAEEKAADPQLYLHPDEYERRADGKVVRKDRWETGLRNVWTILGGVREEFEIEDVVEAVRRLAKALPEASRPLTKAERSMLTMLESEFDAFSAEEWRLHGFQAKTFENLKRKLGYL